MLVPLAKPRQPHPPGTCRTHPPPAPSRIPLSPPRPLQRRPQATHGRRLRTFTSELARLVRDDEVMGRMLDGAMWQLDTADRSEGEAEPVRRIDRLRRIRGLDRLGPEPRPATAPMNVERLASLVVEACEGTGIDYMMAGASSYGVYAIPRSTIDVDVVDAGPGPSTIGQIIGHLDHQVAIESSGIKVTNRIKVTALDQVPFQQEPPGISRRIRACSGVPPTIIPKELSIQT